jgi:hypothetical protein
VQSGAEQLRAWIKRMKLNNVQAAEYLAIPGLDDVVLNKVLNAGRRPELEKLDKIEQKTGIPIRAWLATQLDKAEPVGVGNGRKRR